MHRVPSALSGKTIKRFRVVALAVAGCGLFVSARPAQAADADAFWIGLGGNTSWRNVSNWDTNVIPDGGGATASFNGASGGPIVSLGNSSITLSRLTLNDPLFTSLVGGTINLVGAATVHADGTNFDLPDKVFTSFGSTNPNALRPGNNIGGVGSFAATFVGTAGLTKTGDSHLQIDSQQFYSGTTTINAGKIITTIGDGAFGVIGNSINLNGGRIQVATNNWGTATNSVSRTVNIGSLGGSIYWVDTGRSVDFSGNFTGGGSLELNGRFGSLVGQMTIRSANSLSGTLNIGGGSVVLADNGAFLSVPRIINSGTLILNNSNSGFNVNRITDSTPLIMRGAGLSAIGGATNYNETIGATTLSGGVSILTVSAGSGGARLNLGNLTRDNKAGLVIRGNNLGQTPGANTSNVFINNGTLLLSKGILPFAHVNGSFTGSSTPESADNLLATYGINGVTPITTYSSTFSGANSNTNVRITANSTVTGDAFLNALVVSAPAGHVSVGTFGQTAGLTIGSAGGLLHIDSGVVLSAHAGTLTTGSISVLNSSPGNVIAADMDFGDDFENPAREAIFLTPSALKVTGIISGINGLTKIGNRTLELTGPNNYIGTTYLTGFNRFSGNVFGNGFTPTAYGLDTSPIILYGGNADPFNPNTSSANGTGLGVMGASSPGAVNFDRDIEVRGDWVQLRNFGTPSGTGTVNWNGDLITTDPNTVLMFLQSKATAHQVVNGQVTGPGRVVIGAIDPNPGVAGDPEETWVDLMNPNQFVGGLVISGGTVGIGHDRAMGGTFDAVNSLFYPGSVQFNGNGLLQALNGERNIANKLVIYNTTLGIGGSNTITFSGEINGRGGDFVANITNTAPTTFSGAITGGGFYKQGNGTLVIKGNNTFTGVLKVGNGSLAGGMVILQSNTALGSTAGSTGVEAGQNTLALDGALLPDGRMVIGDEVLYFRGSGVNNLGALRSMTGDNIWGGTIHPSALYSGEGSASPTVSVSFATIGVDNGSTLSIGGAILVDDPGVKNNVGSTLFLANSIGVQKTGLGRLVVGAHVVETQVGTQNFNWNGAIVASGSLHIAQGSVQIQDAAGVPGISNGKSIVDVGSLVIEPSAQLDLSTNALVIDYLAGSPIQTIRGYLRTGYNGAQWNGNGIISSRAATSPNAGEEGPTGIGYAEASLLGITSFYSDPLDGEALVMRYAYMGDANLDGKVTILDLDRLALNWTQTGRTWYDGDFDYNGVVNLNDLMLMVANWQIGLTNPLEAQGLENALAGLGLPPVSVPEPVFGGVLSVLAAFSLSRRRRPH